MSDTKHTPGPWRIKGRTHSSGEFIRIESVHPQKHLYQVADVIAANDYPENEANARLIAAAPALLEALEGLMELERRGRLMPIGREWDAARAAIAAATAPEQAR